MTTLSDIQFFQEFINLEFIARQVVEGFITGLHKSPFHGFSVEFAEHRLYNKGESTKHIDWKLFARTDKLFVKRYEEETNLRSQIVLDISSSMLFPFNDKKKQNKLVFSAVCAAALIYMFRQQRDASGLTLYDNKIAMHTDSRLASVHTKMLFAELEKLLTKGKEDFNASTNTPEVLHQIAENIKRRSLVIIFSDMLNQENQEELFSALQHLRYSKHEVILFHVTDKQLEEKFEFSGRPYRFVDMETGEQIRLNPNEVRNIYQKNIGEYFNDLKLKCAQYSIDLVEADINMDFKQVLLPYLIKRSKLH